MALAGLSYWSRQVADRLTGQIVCQVRQPRQNSKGKTTNARESLFADAHSSERLG
jgi:hypothetical protein